MIKAGSGQAPNLFFCEKIALCLYTLANFGYLHNELVAEKMFSACFSAGSIGMTPMRLFLC